MNPMLRNPVIQVAILASTLALSACAGMRPIWPFGKAAVAAPQPVHELEIVAPADPAKPVVLQFWERNTLVVDLQAVAAAGQVQLARQAGGMWPARLALRVMPGRFDAIEIRGGQRLLAPVSTGATPVTIEVPGSIYDARTELLTIKWGAGSSF
jgi:hypothetical protein